MNEKEAKKWLAKRGYADPMIRNSIDKYSIESVSDLMSEFADYCLKKTFQQSQTVRVDDEKDSCECKDEWLVDVRLNVMKCKKCGQEF